MDRLPSLGISDHLRILLMSQGQPAIAAYYYDMEEISEDKLRLEYREEWKSKNVVQDNTYDLNDPKFEQKVTAWVGGYWGLIVGDWMTADYPETD